MKRKTKIIFTVLIVATLAFIWIHSAMPGDMSSEESGFIFDILSPVLGLILPDELVTEHLVRKLAHFSEYGLLGIEMFSYTLERRFAGVKHVISSTVEKSVLSSNGEKSLLSSNGEKSLLSSNGGKSLLSSTGAKPFLSSTGAKSFLSGNGVKYLLNVLFSGFTVAFFDETIQIFSGRGPMIADMWIDLGGFVCGSLITAAIVIPVMRRRCTLRKS